MSPLQGILPAVVTPLDKDGRFAPHAFERLLERLYAAGIDGLYVCGQTGEGLMLPAGVRKQVAEAAVRLSPKDKTVILHIGAGTTAEAVELARHGASIGAHAVSSLPPAGNYVFDEIRGYYTTLAAACGLPLLVYYFPAVSSAVRTMDQILELCAIPNVAGLKFTDTDLFKLWALRRSGAVVFNGCDEILAAGLLMGASGGIGSIYNLAPEWFVEVYRLARAGRWEEARAVQARIGELIDVILAFPVNTAVKAVLAWTGIDCGLCVAPRATLSAVQEAELLRRLSSTAFGQVRLAPAR